MEFPEVLCVVIGEVGPGAGVRGRDRVGVGLGAATGAGQDRGVSPV